MGFGRSAAITGAIASMISSSSNRSSQGSGHHKWTKKDTIILCSVLGGLIGIPLLILLVHLFIRSCKSVTACVRKRKEDMRERKEARIVEKREVERHERIEAEMHEERKRFWLSKRPGKTYEESGSHPHGKVHAPPLPYL